MMTYPEGTTIKFLVEFPGGLPDGADFFVSIYQNNNTPPTVKKKEDMTPQGAGYLCVIPEGLPQGTYYSEVLIKEKDGDNYVLMDEDECSPKQEPSFFVPASKSKDLL